MKARKQEEKEKRREEISHTAMMYVMFFGGALVMAAIGNAFYGLPNIVTVVLEILLAIPLFVLVLTDPELRD